MIDDVAQPQEPAAADAPPSKGGKKKAEPELVDAPFGWDVVGEEDGRRIARWLGRGEAVELAHRIAEVTGETIQVAPATSH